LSPIVAVGGVAGGAGSAGGGGAGGAGAVGCCERGCDVVVVSVVVDCEYVGTYEYGELTVCPVNSGYTKSRTGYDFTAVDMKRFQISAGSEPPKTALQPSML
jgi:hypothetical protein